MPGLTRDAISVPWLWKNKQVQIVDTAGIRRGAKRKRSDEIEDLAVLDAMRAMKFADVAVLVLDSQARVLQRQELAIADAVVREGRSLVISANKMDWVVGHGTGNWDESAIASYNLVNPVRRDTATLLPYGWTVIRVRLCNSSNIIFTNSRKLRF